MSGRRNTHSPFHFIVAGDLSADYTSPQTNILYLDNVAVQLIWTGTPTGSFYVQVSLDGSTWNNLILNPTPAAAGSADSVGLDINQLSFAYMRIKYVSGSGTGTLQGYISAKME
jgi:hypothetical protein